MRPMCIADYENLARRRLPRALFGFASLGSESQTTLRANRAALDNFFLVPNVLCDIAARTSRTELFGATYSVPFGIAPMGGAALFHHRADLVLAQHPIRSERGIIGASGSHSRRGARLLVSGLPACESRRDIGTSGKIETHINRRVGDYSRCAGSGQPLCR